MFELNHVLGWGSLTNVEVTLRILPINVKAINNYKNLFLEISHFLVV